MSNEGSSRRAFSLLMELRNVVQEQDNTISAQTEKIELLEQENAHLRHQLKALEFKLKDKKTKDKETKIIRSSSATSASYKRDLDGGDLSNSVRRSSSFQKRHLEEQDASKRVVAYELSSDIIDKQIQVLRNVYGGQRKAEDAARIIQQAFRKYRMKQNFRKIRHSKTRRLTIENKLTTSINNSNENKSSSEEIEDSNTSEIENSDNAVSTSMVEVVELVLEHSYTENNNKKATPALHTQSTDNENISNKLSQSMENVTNSSNSSENETTVSLEETDTGTLKRNKNKNQEDNFDEESTPKASGENSDRDFSEKEVENPIKQDDLVAQILSSTPPQMIEEANSSHRKRKRHGYETVVPLRIKDITKESVENQSSDNNSLTNTDDDTVDNVQKNNFRRSVPTSSSLRSRNSDRDSVLLSAQAWSRTGSDISLQDYQNDADGDSIRSSDTASIASTQSDLSAFADGYQRRSTLSTRGSWHVDTSNDVMRKRLYRIGLNLFNKKPSKGLEFLIENSFVARTAPAVAHFLLNRKGLSKQMVGEYLGNTQKRFNQDVLDSVCELMDFSGMDLDEALRHFQSQIKVQGEAQKVERLIEAFSQRYCVCNPKMVESLHNPDAIFILAFAIIMLNTDLHTPNIKQEKRMTAAAFAKNLRGIDGDHDLDEEMLTNIYNRIRKEELKTNDDHVTQVLNVEKSILGKKPVLAVPYRRLVCYCRLYQVTDPTKPQKPGLHQREVFLFNDLLLVTKVLQRKKNNTTYTCKSSFPLQGMNVLLFETTYYLYGIRLISLMDDKPLITFNAPNDHDRNKFITDLRESIHEVQQMENYRIGAELERVQMTNEPRSGLSDSKKMSSSMQNLNDTTGKSMFSSQLTSISDRPVSMYAMQSPIEPNQNNHNNGSAKNHNSNNNNNMNNHLLNTPAKSESSLLGSFFGSGRRSKSPSNNLQSPVNKNIPQITFTYSSKV